MTQVTPSDFIGTTIGSLGGRTYMYDPAKVAGSPPVGERIALALVRAQAAVKDAGKSGDNKFDKYTYSKLEDFLGACDAALESNQLALTMETVEATMLPERETKNGGREHAVQVCVKGRLIHSSGEELIVYGYGQGQDRADKALYKAITGAKKYLVAGLLKIATTDDPEADETVGLAAKGKGKLNSEGVPQPRIPKWNDAQKLRAGTLNAKVLELLTQSYGDAAPADDELHTWKNQHKYDEPETVLKALEQWVKDLQGLP